MEEYITIRNVGPLRSVESLNIKPFTVLIGESASGKSTLMKLVSTMRYLYKMANIRSYLKHSKITSSPFRVRFDHVMAANGLGKMFGADSLIEYRVRMDGEAEYAICVENKKLGKLPIIAPCHLMFNKVSFISENRNIIPVWTQRASQNPGAKLGFYFHETNSDFAMASADDKEVDLNYVGMKLHISHPKGKPAKYTVMPVDGRHSPIELRDASSGIQTSSSMALIVKYFASGFSFKDAFKRSVLNYLYDMERLSKFEAVTEPGELRKEIFVHIEEPELSLFPDAQCKLVDEIIYSATHSDADRKVNLMLATHSPYILNYLNIVLNQTKEGRASLDRSEMAVYRIFDGEAQDLLMQNERGHWIVDTYDLSELMGNIYNEFVSLDI